MNDILPKIEYWVEEHREELIGDIARLVAVPSVYSTPAENAPYGEESARVIDVAGDLCQKYGIFVRNYDYHVCTADLNDKPACLDILTHLDVVDVGDGWETDPWTATEKDGWLYGRGTADDKSAAVAALYAMRAVRELRIPLSGNVRLIMGAAEESGSPDLKYYLQREKSAPHSISPDFEFPVYNTEKGRFRPKFFCELLVETALPRVDTIQGGTIGNVVPDKASAVILGLKPETVHPLMETVAADCGVSAAAEPVEGGCMLTVMGRSAHGMTPEKGINANTALIAILNRLPLAETASTILLRGLERFLPHGDGRGKAMGVALRDEISGELTMSFNLLRLENGQFSGGCDSRVPVCSNEENCYGVVVGKLEDLGLRVQTTVIQPHHVPAEEPFVQSLLAAYEAVTGEPGQCLATGGGTYVHEIEGGVAFGPVMPGVQTNMHGANERIPVKDLLASVKIFALAIADVCR